MAMPAANDAIVLSASQQEMVELFIHIGQTLGLPKSVGAIYGLLYALPDPLPLDTIVASLQISRGSASQGLRFLQNLNAVQVIYPAGQRRDHFTAERRLRRLAEGFLRERVAPHVETGAERLERIEQAISPEDPHAAHVQANLERLRKWYNQSRLLLPLLRRVIG